MSNPNLSTEELDNLVSDEFGDDVSHQSDDNAPADEYDDNIDDISDEEAEKFTASDKEYGQSIPSLKK